jgi:hypothetical protein
LILRINGVEIDDIGDGQASLRLRDQIDEIAGSHFTFKEYGEVEAGTTAAQKALQDVWPTESDAELEAGHPRLRDGKLRRPYSETVPDPDVVKMDGRTVCPRHSISRGSPTFSDTTFMRTSL